jgi:hypothetical protein
MRAMMHRRNSARPDGYAALLPVIVLAAVLLMAVANESIAGWRARTRVLGTSAHEQARALADGCATLALNRMLFDPSFAGGTTHAGEDGNCRVFPIETDAPAPGLATIDVQGVVRGYYADEEIVVRLHAACGGASPLPSALQIESWQEVPTYE